MNFDAFDTKKMDEYAAQAKENWGKTDAYKEFEEKSKNWTEDSQNNITAGLIGIFAEFGEIKDLDPASEKAQAQVKKLQDYITKHYYTR